jgi:hypothetical protein
MRWCGWLAGVGEADQDWSCLAELPTLHRESPGHSLRVLDPEVVQYLMRSALYKYVYFDQNSTIFVKSCLHPNLRHEAIGVAGVA